MSNDSRNTHERMNANRNDQSDKTCVVCTKTVELFSIGECDHAVCYECSTRMRVLCEQNECPICRQGLSKVIFTTERLSYRELEANNRSEYYNKKYKICFSNLKIQKAFYDLLQHSCPICQSLFNSFQILQEHVRKEHEMFYCDICTDNLKIFSLERKCYNRAGLAMHRRKGDVDNTSHRGHPLCEYCDLRYLDRDELFRHLRREHYYCHFCDADGSNNYYADSESLRDHFKKEHYVCEEGECAGELLTGVFRSDIDLKAHTANVHGKSLSKQAAKQARTLQLEITLGPRGRSGQDSHIANLRRERERDREYEDSLQNYQAPTQQPPRMIDAKSEQEFPSLGGTSGGTSLTSVLHPSMTMRARTFGPAGLARTKENFPALGAGGDIPIRQIQPVARSNQQPTSAILRNPASQSSQSKSSSGGMVIHVSNRPKPASAASGGAQNLKQSDFPALPGGAKRNNRNSLFDEDVPINPVSQFNSSALSAKHRSLVDDYVSVVQPTGGRIKIAPVDFETTTKKSIQQSAPNLTGNEFPALASGSSVNDMSWVRPKQREESRKSKIAPAPILFGNNVKTTANSIPNEKKDARKQNKPKDVPNGENEQNARPHKSPQTNEKQKINIKHENNNENKISNKNRQQSKKENSGKNAQQKPNSRDDSLDKNDVNANTTATKKSNIILPPPGFSFNGTDESAAAKVPPPPPGFNSVTLQSVAKSLNNFTFTSSLGQKFSILPSHKYLPPPNFEGRNQVLVDNFNGSLKFTEAVEEFRYISKRFREGLYRPAAYYEHCQAALKDRFDEVFPELLVLLPDINKQQELYLVHSQYQKEKENRLHKKFHQNLEVCSTCKQVILNADVNDHYQSHAMENNFPALSKKTPINSKLSNRK